ncbi:transposase [Bacillus wiedmannii]|nr:transposase [Bacillus wiedmannii]
MITTDKVPSILNVSNNIESAMLYKHTTHCTIKHLNNLITQGHRHIKRLYFKVFAILHTPLKESKPFISYVLY